MEFLKRHATVIQLSIGLLAFSAVVIYIIKINRSLNGRMLKVERNIEKILKRPLLPKEPMITPPLPPDDLDAEIEQVLSEQN